MPASLQRPFPGHHLLERVAQVRSHLVLVPDGRVRITLDGQSDEALRSFESGVAQLTRLPRMSRIQSSFAIRDVLQRLAPLSLFQPVAAPAGKRKRA